MALQLVIGSGTETSAAARCVALLLTYFVHVALWTTAAAWVAGRRGVSPALRHVLWTMALLGPMLTALCPVAIVEKLAGAPVALTRAPFVVSVVSRDLGSPSAATLQPWAAVMALWLGATLLGALHFAGSFAWLWHSVRDRRALTDPRLLARLQVLCDKSGLSAVRVSDCPRIAGPMVLGRAEICVPRKMLEDLSDAEVDGVFAHELAHLERGDGLWFPLVGLVQSVLWTHPLNHVLAARIRQSAELACDDRAVALTGDALGLARALTAVAERTPFTHRGVAVPTMARSAKTLVQRVARLVNGSSSGSSRRRHGAVAAIAALAVTGIATASLDIRVASALTQTHSTSLPKPAPDADALQRELNELLEREQRLEAELSAARNVPGASREGTQAAVNVIELSQALNHIREQEAWTENRNVEAWQKSQNHASR